MQSGTLNRLALSDLHGTHADLLNKKGQQVEKCLILPYTRITNPSTHYIRSGCPEFNVTDRSEQAKRIEGRD